MPIIATSAAPPFDFDTEDKPNISCHPARCRDLSALLSLVNYPTITSRSIASETLSEMLSENQSIIGVSKDDSRVIELTIL